MAENLETLCRVVGADEDEPIRVVRYQMNPHCTEIDLPDFARWAKQAGWDPPAELCAILPEHDDVPAGGWPWGTEYETPLLRAAVVGIRQWWLTWEPGLNPPTNEDVADFLMKKCNLSQPEADAVAKVIRSDKAPKGRPKGS